MTPISTAGCKAGRGRLNQSLNVRPTSAVSTGCRGEGDAAMATRIRGTQQDDAAYASIGFLRQHFKRNQAAQAVCDQVDDSTGSFVDEAG